VVTHRALFRLHARGPLVAAGQRLALAGLSALGLSVTGVVVLIFDVVAGTTAAVAGGVGTLVIFGLLWVALPLWQRHRSED
jgi:hypothetical protein